MLENYLPNSLNTINVLGNSVSVYIYALVAFFVFIFAFKIFQVIIISRLKVLAKKTKTDLDDTFIRIINSLKPPFYSFLAFFFAIQFISINGSVEKIIETVFVVWVVYQIIHAVQILIDYGVKKKTGDEKGDGGKSAISLLSLISKIVLWSFGLLFILSNLGVNITSLIAGLGIGGIAIAFALQNILSDLFSSFSIFFDKPFRIGDFIVFGDKSGTVEKIGIKTTRVRALQGEELVVSNNQLTTSLVQNFKKLKERRIVVSIGVTYRTTSEKVKRVPKIVKNIVEKTNGTRFDRTHFKSFGDSALLFEIVYYITSPEYSVYMDINEEINLGIKEVFEKEGIEMAFPTQTIYIEK